MFPLQLLSMPMRPKSHSARLRNRYHRQLHIRAVTNRLILGLNSLNVSHRTRSHSNCASLSRPTHVTPSVVTISNKPDSSVSNSSIDSTPSVLASTAQILVTKYLMQKCRNWCDATVSRSNQRRLSCGDGQRRPDCKSPSELKPTTTSAAVGQTVVGGLSKPETAIGHSSRQYTGSSGITGEPNPKNNESANVVTETFISVQSLNDDAHSSISSLSVTGLSPVAVRAYSTASAVPLNAAIISLPKVPGTIDLTSRLPKHFAERYESAEKLLRPVTEVQFKAIRPRVGGSRAEYLKLVKIGVDSNLFGLTETPKVICGLHAVPKDGGAAQRLIIDARPANLLFIDPEPVALPTPDLLAELTIPSNGQQLFVAKSDLSDFYHTMRLPVWLTEYFALPSVQYREIGIDKDGWVHPKCLTLPMGFSHSVLIAQLIHEKIVSDAGIFRMAPPLARFKDASIDLAVNNKDDDKDKDTTNDKNENENEDSDKDSAACTRCQLYIDDFIVYGLDPEVVRRIQLLHEAAVSDSGFLIKRSKSVLPTSEPVECVGITIDGRSGTVAVAPETLNELIGDTERLIAGGSCTGIELSRIVGGWTWAFLVRRPAFAIFANVYRFITQIDRRRSRLWSSVLIELQLACAVAPVLVTTIRRMTVPVIVACDASSTGYGVTLAPVTPERVLPVINSTVSADIAGLVSVADSGGARSAIAINVLRQVNKKVVTNGFGPTPANDNCFILNLNENDKPSIPDHELLPCVSGVFGVDSHPRNGGSGGDELPNSVRLLSGDPRSKLPAFRGVYDWIKRQNWKVAVSGEWDSSNPEHINISEVRAALSGIRSVFRTSAITGVSGIPFDHRFVLFTDSLVTLGALNKGRSSSHLLLRRIRSVSATLLATGIRPFYRYIDTESNPADVPSRQLCKVGARLG